MITIRADLQAVTAFAPASCANVAVGFDLLGFAFAPLGDQVTLTRRKDSQLVIEHIDGAENLPVSIEKNTAGVVLQHLLKELQIKEGFSIAIHKGIPLSSGLGGSAASAIAALTAFNEFVGGVLTQQQLAEYALIGEQTATGQRHGDNIAPCLFGGFTLLQTLKPFQVLQLPIPDLFIVAVHPHIQVDTRHARSILKNTISLKQHTEQANYLAQFIIALHRHDFNLLKQSLQDVIIEPQRAPLIPGFEAIKKAALQCNALGVMISGSGPTVVAFATTQHDAQLIGAAMTEKFAQHKVPADLWINPISEKGARVIEVKKNAVW